ncbi:MAG: HEAT repeat domain-containing protein [Terriglobales bacterium]|jgi:hypothetical protein
MGIRWLVVVCLCWSAIAAGQTSGRFYTEKDSYALGEPIFVYFQVVNNGPKPETLQFGDPYSIQPGCSPYRINVSRDRPFEPRPNLSCPARGLSVVCGSYKAVLQPGEVHVDRILLNLSHKVDAAGMYTLQAAYGVPFSGLPEGTPEIHSTLDFLVEEKPPDKKLFQPWVDQLRSTDRLKRAEAARILASVAPRSLEDIILTFADDPWISQYAPLAFHRLNAPRSLEALKALMTNPDASRWEQRKAADYLANDQCAGDF